MNRSSLNGMWILIAAAVGIAGGFLVGKREGGKPAVVHKAMSAALRKQLREAERTIEELELRLATADDAVAIHADSNAAELLELDPASRDSTVFGPMAFEPVAIIVDAEALMGPPAAATPGEMNSSTLRRIEELEYEMAALKQTVGRTAEMTAAPSQGAGSSKFLKFQCSAQTKKGTRCTRTARADGKCWQHGG